MYKIFKKCLFLQKCLLNFLELQTGRQKMNPPPTFSRGANSPPWVIAKIVIERYGVRNWPRTPGFPPLIKSEKADLIKDPTHTALDWSKTGN